MTVSPLRITDAAAERLKALNLADAVRREVEAAPSDAGLELTILDDALTLRDPESRGKGLRVDPARGRLGHRLRPGAVDHEPVVRVARLGGSKPTRVLDATAGLGRDALVLAVAGCAVTAVERSAVISALVLDGLQRAEAADNHHLAEAITRRLHWRAGEGMEAFAEAGATEPWDVVYLDPMFAVRTKSAAVKQEMRLLQRWLGPGGEPDEAALLTAARSAARRRVVVKRAAHAAPLGGVAPDFAKPGRSVRFDVYLTGDRRL